MATYTEVHGERLGLLLNGSLATAKGLQITQPCVDASITVGAEVSNVRAITIQLNDANGVAINYIQSVDIEMYVDSAGADFVATGGSTGIAAGASGKILAVVAKKLFKARSSSAGAIALTWTDTGTEAAYLGLKLPNGRVVISSALTNT